MNSSTLSELAQLEAQISERLSDPELAQAEQRLGSLYARIGELDQALAHLSTARRVAVELREARRIATLDASLGQILAHKGELDDAAAFLERAGAAAASLDDADLAARVCTQLGELALRRGDPGQAHELYVRARRHFEKYWDGAELATIYSGLALHAAARGGHDEADRLGEKALEDAEAAGDPLVIGRVLLRRAHTRQKASDGRAAKRAFRRAITVLADHELRRDLAEAYLAYGSFVGASSGEPDGESDAPAYWLAKAQALFRELGGTADVERVREAFRRHGRRNTDRIADRLYAQSPGSFDSAALEREHTRTLLELCRSLSMIQDHARLPGEIARMVTQLTQAERVVVALVGEDGKPHLRGLVQVSDGQDGPWGPAIAAALARSGAATLLGTRAPDRRAAQGDRQLGTGMACPLRHGDRLMGAIYADKQPGGGMFGERDLDLLAIFAAQVATILENARVGEELHLAARTRAATLEAISDGVLKLGVSGVVTSINSAAMRILGVSAGADLRQLRLASFPDLAWVGGCLARGEDFDGRVVRLATGDHLANGRIVRVDGGELEGMLVTLTEMKRATSLAQRIVGSTARFTFADLVGTSPLLRRRLQLAEAAARSDSNVLVTGESGTGKELLAQAIHNGGVRAGGPFVGINCAAIPRELLESELFGYEAGAFTGAKRGGHPGKFELADGGTILLDEIGDMPLEMQAKLLRVLQEKRVQRLGGTRELPLDTRVIATTNRDLTEDAVRGRFRQDLFFRLRVIHIELPPLRARGADIPVLVDHFLERFSARLGKQVRGVSPQVLDVLLAYSWPGNVRELEHVLEGEVNLASPAQELLNEVPIMLESVGVSARSGLGLADGSIDETLPGHLVSLEESEKQLLLAALVRHHGNVPDVARALGVSRGTVYNKMKKFQIDPEAYRSA